MYPRSFTAWKKPNSQALRNITSLRAVSVPQLEEAILSEVLFFVTLSRDNVTKKRTSERMASSSWGTDTALSDVMFRNAWEFGFFQAVKLLGYIYPDRMEVGAIDRKSVVQGEGGGLE